MRAGAAPPRGDPGGHSASPLCSQGRCWASPQCRGDKGRHLPSRPLQGQPRGAETTRTPPSGAPTPVSR